MEPQTLFNLACTIAGALGGWMLNRLWASVDHLTDQDIKLADKVQAIELLVAGQYVRRVELDGTEARIIARLDQIWNELKGKADKPQNGNGGGDMTLKTGSDGPAFGVSWYNPLTGGFGSPVQYKQHVDPAKHTSHWLPRGLTLAKVRAGDTAGYKKVRAADGVPGWVWVKR